MKARITGPIAGVAVALLGGCAEDPLSDLDASPAAIVADATNLQMTVGDVRAVTASVVDGRATPLEVPVTFSPCDADVTVQADASYDPVPRTSSRANVTAVGLDVSCVALSGGGLRDTIPAVVLPFAFDGTISSTSPDVGDTLTLNATGVLRLDAATADIDFGDGLRGLLVSRTGTVLSVVVPQPDAAQPARLTVDEVDVPYVPGLRVSLPTASPINITNPYDPNDLPDPVATAPIPGAFYDGFISSTCTNGVGTACDNFYSFTLSGTTTFTVTLEWSTGADLDILFCDLGCNNFVGNFNGATAANPEVTQVTLGAGTYNLWINTFDDADEPAHLYKITITTP